MNNKNIKAWVGLQQHAEEMADIHLNDLFQSDDNRFDS
jgi:hypothetical protein